jgi:hypothetical protein
MRRFMAACALVAFSSGCVPILVGALIIKSSKSKGQQQEFTSQLEKTNADRESKGLPPLDWCSEAYHFDKGWAENDKGCAARIAAYEAGDRTALNSPALATVTPDATAATASTEDVDTSAATVAAPASTSNSGGFGQSKLP